MRQRGREGPRGALHCDASAEVYATLSLPVQFRRLLFL